MKWYVAKLIVECTVDGYTETLCDEQIRVIRASGPLQAKRKAEQIGKSEENTYLNSDGKTVSWRFAGLSDLDEILGNSIESGTEICCTLHHNTRASELVVEDADLTVNWAKANRHRKTSELLDEQSKRFAP